MPIQSMPTPDPTSQPRAGAPASRILLCGIGPVPLGNPDRLYAPGLRVWGIAHALLDVGCAVDLLEIQFGKTEQGLGARIHRMRFRDESGAHTNPSTDLEADTQSLAPASPADLVAQCLDADSYSAVVATTDVMADACAQRCGDLPLWCDFNGHPMAERQSLATCYSSDEGIAGQWDAILAPLLRGDRFSSCCEAQRHALIGELGACGRLNRLTDGEKMVVSLPPAAIFTEFPPARGLLRPRVVPDGAFVILWTGGYNTWADPDTLAQALVDAMQREPRIRYVSTGGAIQGHDDRTFGRFRSMIDGSPIADRCHFVGWVPTVDVFSYYQEADVGVNCDRPTLEGELGARNRIQDWVCAGLPVATTNVCEMTRDLAKENLIHTFEPGDARGLADLFVRLSREPHEPLRRRAEQARRAVLEKATPPRLYREMADWARAPRPSGDRPVRGVGNASVPFSVPDNPLARRRAEEWVAVQAARHRSRRPAFVRRFLRLLGE